jgi:23S rRNA (uridine2552-2'-O)-methyltransferase
MKSFVKSNLNSKKKRSASSKNWLTRQINDPYVLLAKEQGYKSRAAFKILEINEKYKIFHKNQMVVDLGASPGGWSQVVSKIVSPLGKVLALDLLEMDYINGVTFLQGDFNDDEVLEKLAQTLDGKADVILSDMAPSTCGISKVDHLRIVAILEQVFLFCDDCLKEGGTLVAKIFQGGAQSDLLAKIQKRFKKVCHFKPKSSRKESSEMYLVAMGYR